MTNESNVSGPGGIREGGAIGMVLAVAAAAFLVCMQLGLLGSVFIPLAFEQVAILAVADLFGFLLSFTMYWSGGRYLKRPRLTQFVIGLLYVAAVIALVVMVGWYLAKP